MPNTCAAASAHQSPRRGKPQAALVLRRVARVEPHRIRIGIDLKEAQTYNHTMKTLTLSQAKGKLATLLDRAKRGEEIGIISGDKIIQLKPVEVVPWEETYLWKEYGLTGEEATRFADRLDRRISDSERKRHYKMFSGDLEKDCVD